MPSEPKVMPSRRARAVRAFQRDLSADREVRRFEVGLPDRGQRLDVFLAARLRWASRARVGVYIAEDRVRVAGRGAEARVPRAALRLHAGDEVVVTIDAVHVEASQPGRTEPFLVVFEDRWLLAVSKPPACSVHPTKRHRAGSLVELVHRRERELPPEARQPEGWLPSPCHRLDRDTSGLVLFARDPATRAEVGRQIESRSVRKVYLAWVRGEVREEHGEIELPIGPDDSSSLANRRAVRPNGQPSITRWRVVERFTRHTLVEAEPVTGRTHQLRVHLAAIGHPILGDALYGLPGADGDELFVRRLSGMSDQDVTRLVGYYRLALHAERLELEHPELRRPLSLLAPPWADLRALGAAP